MNHPMCPHCEDNGCMWCGGVMLGRFQRYEHEQATDEVREFLKSVNSTGQISESAREMLRMAIRWGAEKERDRFRASKGADEPADDGFARRFEMLDLDNEPKSMREVRPKPGFPDVLAMSRFHS